MKTKILFILFSMTILLGFSQDAYYWHKSKKVVLKEIAEKKFIIFNGEQEEADLKNVLKIPTIENVINGNTVLAKSVIPYNNRFSAIDTWMIIDDSLFRLPTLKDTMKSSMNLVAIVRKKMLNWPLPIYFMSNCMINQTSCWKK